MKLYIIGLLIGGIIGASACGQDPVMALGNDLLNLGNSLYQKHDIEAAYDVYMILSRHFPYSSAINYNVGFALAELNRPTEAVNYYRKALEHTIDSVDTHYALSTALLAAQDYTAGWQEYEWRWQLPDKLLEKRFFGACPMWHQEDLNNKTIILSTEGALGDAIQFIRYAEIAKEMGAYVIVRAPQALHNLFLLCPYIDLLVSYNDSMEQITEKLAKKVQLRSEEITVDYYCSLMSMPARMNTTIDTVHNKIPYIYANNQMINNWSEILNINIKKEYTIGLCWQADLYNDSQRPPLARRSLNFSDISCLLQSKICNKSAFISLQRLSLQESSVVHDFLINNNINNNIYIFDTDFDESHGRFMDTAAVIKNLDLVITVDTSIAHLSGALGVPTWVILPYKSDWRWATERNDSVWYPGMRLFRRGKDETWVSVINKINQELEKLFIK